MRTVLMCFGCQLAFPDIYKTPGSHFSLEKPFRKLFKASKNLFRQEPESFLLEIEIVFHFSL